MEPAVDVADGVKPLVVWIVDKLISSKASIAADHKAFACHASMEFLLVWHGPVQPQCL